MASSDIPCIGYLSYCIIIAARRFATPSLESRKGVLFCGAPCQLYALVTRTDVIIEAQRPGLHIDDWNPNLSYETTGCRESRHKYYYFSNESRFAGGDVAPTILGLHRYLDVEQCKCGECGEGYGHVPCKVHCLRLLGQSHSTRHRSRAAVLGECLERQIWKVIAE
jgi:hypothetical protein